MRKSDNTKRRYLMLRYWLRKQGYSQKPGFEDKLYFQYLLIA